MTGEIDVVRGVCLVSTWVAGELYRDMSMVTALWGAM